MRHTCHTGYEDETIWEFYDSGLDLRFPHWMQAGCYCLCIFISHYIYICILVIFPLGKLTRSGYAFVWIPAFSDMICQYEAKQKERSCSPRFELICYQTFDYLSKV